MPETKKYYLGDEEDDERERSERERKEILKKESEDIAIDIALKRARLRQYLSDRKLEKEIISLEKKVGAHETEVRAFPAGDQEIRGRKGKER